MGSTPTIPDLFHDIFNRLNAVTVIAGVLRDRLKDREGVPFDYLSSGLRSIEAAACDAAKDLEKLKDILKQEGRYY